MGTMIFSFFAAVMVFAVGGIFSLLTDKFIDDEFKEL